jgi:hypothetical protein
MFISQFPSYSTVSEMIHCSSEFDNQKYKNWHKKNNRSRCACLRMPMGKWPSMIVGLVDCKVHKPPTMTLIYNAPMPVELPMRVFFLSPTYNASASSCPPLPPNATAHVPEIVAYGLSPPLLPVLPNSSILCPCHRPRPPVVFHRPTTALPRLTAHRSATAAGSAASPRPSLYD